MKKGLTLVEVMVVIFISTVVISALMMVMSTGRRTWYLGDAQVAVQQELRKAMTQMADDLRSSGESKVLLPADGNTYGSISFSVAQGITGGGLINWSSDSISYGLSSGQVIRTFGAGTRVIANNITQLTFARNAASPKVVRINLTATKATPFSQTLNASVYSAISLRN